MTTTTFRSSAIATLKSLRSDGYTLNIKLTASNADLKSELVRIDNQLMTQEDDLKDDIEDIKTYSPTLTGEEASDKEAELEDIDTVSATSPTFIEILTKCASSLDKVGATSSDVVLAQPLTEEEVQDKAAEIDGIDDGVTPTTSEYEELVQLVPASPTTTATNDNLFTLLAEIFTLVFIALPAAVVSDTKTYLLFHTETLREAYCVLHTGVTKARDSIVFESFYRGCVALTALVIYGVVVLVEGQMPKYEAALRLT